MPPSTRPSDLPPAGATAHGTRARYVDGCRCPACRVANTQSARARARARRRPADEARAHLVALQSAGVGTRRVADLTGLDRHLVARIRAGERATVTARVETRIRAIPVAPLPFDTGLVDATPTLQRLVDLDRRGWSQAEIARALGRVTPVLSIRSDRVTARFEARVTRVYRRLVAADNPLVLPLDLEADHGDRVKFLSWVQRSRAEK